MANNGSAKHSILFLPHGGGPMPLLNDPSHKGLTNFLRDIPKKLIKPKQIILISAHWEAQKIQILSSSKPDLLFDYYGFPDESYHFTYPAPGSPELAQQVKDALAKNGIEAELEANRGYDHGVFVPLKLMYPEADIPILQISLHASLDPATHIKLGEAISHLVDEATLLIGSGLSFHNMRAFFSPANPTSLGYSQEFDQWLTSTLAKSVDEAQNELINWAKAPQARYCHPREEHLLPLLVCFGAAKHKAMKLASVYGDTLLNARISAFAS